MKLLFIKVYILLFLICYSFSKNQYYLSNPVYSEDHTQFSGILYFKGDFSPEDYHYDWTRITDLLVPIEKLNIQISLECNKYLHIYVTDALEKRWEHPFSISESYKQKLNECLKDNSKKSLEEFGLYISENVNEPFYISLKNPSNDELIFTTENTDF